MKKEEYYSIWWMPTGDIYNKFAGIITRLSKEYSSPHFEPHVTLLTRIALPKEEMLVRTEKLASILKALKIQLTTIGHQDYYLRALFVKVKKTHQILWANRKAKKVFSLENSGEYMPHLSLLYGDFPQTVKKKIIEDIGRNFRREFEVRSIHLVKADYKTTTWYRIKSFPLE